MYIYIMCICIYTLSGGRRRSLFSPFRTESLTHRHTRVCNAVLASYHPLQGSMHGSPDIIQMVDLVVQGLMNVRIALIDTKDRDMSQN